MCSKSKTRDSLDDDCWMLGRIEIVFIDHLFFLTPVLMYLLLQLKAYSRPLITNHLFYCRSNPTKLQVSDLWSKPKETARFL